MPGNMHTTSHDTDVVHKVKCLGIARPSSEAPKSPNLRLRTVDTRIWGIESTPTSPVECKQVLQGAVEEALNKIVIPRLHAVEQSLGIGLDGPSTTSFSSRENISSFRHLLSQHNAVQHRSSSLSRNSWSALQTADDIEAIRSEVMAAWNAAVPQLSESADSQSISNNSIASEILPQICPSISSLRSALEATTNLLRRQRLEELIDETQLTASMSSAMPIEVTFTADKPALRTKVEAVRPQTDLYTSWPTTNQISHDPRSEGYDQSSTLCTMAGHSEKVSDSLTPASHEQHDSEQLNLDSVQLARKASEESAMDEASCKPPGSDNDLPLNKERLEIVMKSLKDELNTHMTAIKDRLDAIPERMEKQVSPTRSKQTVSFHDMKDSLPSSITEIFRPNRRKKESGQLERLLSNLLHGVNDIKSVVGAIELKQDQTLLSSPPSPEVAAPQGKNPPTDIATRHFNHHLATMIQNNDDQTLLHPLADTNFHVQPHPRLESTGTRSPVQFDGIYAGLARPSGGRAMASSILTRSSNSTFSISVRRPKGARSMTDSPRMSSNSVFDGL